VPQQRRRRSDRRERILDAAFETLVEDGYAGMTISGVERRVGLAPGTGSLHYYFRSKDELVRAAVEHGIAQRLAETAKEREAVTWPETQSEQAALAAKLVLGHICRFQPLFRLLQSDTGQIPDLRQSVVSALAGGGGSGDWLLDPSRVAPLAALAGYVMFASLWDGPGEMVDEDEFIAFLMSVLPESNVLGLDPEGYARLDRQNASDRPPAARPNKSSRTNSALKGR
jgi:AcrR family transcriptional regulator